MESFLPLINQSFQGQRDLVGNISVEIEGSKRDLSEQISMSFQRNAERLDAFENGIRQHSHDLLSQLQQLQSSGRLKPAICQVRISVQQLTMEEPDTY